VEIGALIIFLLVYLGMILGTWPGLVLDRTGIALLGAIAFIELQNIPLGQIVGYVDFSALAILFSFMIVSAQFYFSGFYTHIVSRLGKWKLSPSQLLLAMIFISAGLSAILLNDIVCLALTPLIIRSCLDKNLKPLPFLLGLACASNIGSSLTLVGNPQNLLIGQVLSIPFAQYMKYSIIPCLLGLVATWGMIHWQMKGAWTMRAAKIEFASIPYDRWQSSKGLLLIVILLFIFFFFDVPRDHISLIVAGLLLLSRQFTSQTMLSFIDWQLLVLFIGLFIVNRGFLNTHQFEVLLQTLQAHNVDLQSPSWIFIFSSILSNIVSNVPAVMLLLPFVKTNFIGSLLAISSTLAGNMFIVGSIANLIVITQASKFGIQINWKKHLLVGLPVAIFTLLVAASWFYLLSIINLI
jgi:Na+/H+ antiporter NhaD/arsenite permease-like protein